MTRFFFLPLSFVLAMTLELVLSHYLGPWGLAPNLLLVGALYFGLTRGPWTGAWMGFLWGLVLDASSIALFGAQALLLLWVGYLAGFFAGQVDETKPVAQAALTFGVSCFYLVAFWLLDALISPVKRHWPMAFFAQPFLNALMAMIMFRVLNAWTYRRRAI